MFILDVDGANIHRRTHGIRGSGAFRHNQFMVFAGCADFACAVRKDGALVCNVFVVLACRLAKQLTTWTKEIIWTTNVIKVLATMDFCPSVVAFVRNGSVVESLLSGSSETPLPQISVKRGTAEKNGVHACNAANIPTRNVIIEIFEWYEKIVQVCNSRNVPFGNVAILGKCTHGVVFPHINSSVKFIGAVKGGAGGVGVLCPR